MKKRFFVVLGVSIFLTLLLAGCIDKDGVIPEKFPEPRLDFADGWVKIEHLDTSRHWVEDPAPADRAWGQVTELPRMPIKKGAEYRISFDSSKVTGKFLSDYTVKQKGAEGWDDNKNVDVVFEDIPEITWVDWTITCKPPIFGNKREVTLTALECKENLMLSDYPNEFYMELRKYLRDEIGNASSPFLSTAIAPDIIAGTGRPAVINSNDPFDVFSKTECTMTYTVRFTYLYQYKKDDGLRQIEKTVDKMFTVEVVK